jgi:hypothetical protein
VEPAKAVIGWWVWWFLELLSANARELAERELKEQMRVSRGWAKRALKATKPTRGRR